MWWILAFTGGRAPILVVLLSFVRVCLLCRKMGWWLFREDGIKVSPPSPHPDDVSSIIGRRVEVCFRRIHSWWICSDLVVVYLYFCVFKLDPSDLRSSSMAAVAVLVCWFHGALARRLPDCLLQQVLPGSDEEGVMTAARF